MSSHPYVTQQNTPLADDTTLMSTTDLQSYITHANDTFVQVSVFIKAWWCVKAGWVNCLHYRFAGGRVE